MIVDFVALTDGTSFGASRTNMMSQAQSMINAQRSLLSYLLDQVAPQKTSAAIEALIRNELKAKEVILHHVPPLQGKVEVRHDQ